MITTFANGQPYLRIEAAQFPAHAVLRCIGEIDVASAGCLRRALTAAIRVELSELEVDLREVSFLDNAAIRVLLEAQDILHAQGRSLRVRVNPRTARLFRLLQLSHLFTHP